MEAWLHGVATQAQVAPVLQDLLNGIASGPPTPVSETLLCMASPPSNEAPKSEAFFFLDNLQGTWCARGCGCGIALLQG